MQKHRRELIRQLFVLATEILEDTHEFASAGQAAGKHRNQYLTLNRRLSTAASELSAITGAITAAARPANRGG